MDKMQLKALAKINLGLDVLRRREDGYHEVRMIMQTVRIFDRIQLVKQERSGIRVRTNLYYLPANENNLVYKAANLLFEEFGLDGGLSIDLKKYIPVAAGMAGGSSDAAAVLYGIPGRADEARGKDRSGRTILSDARNRAGGGNRRGLKSAAAHAALQYSGGEAGYQRIHKVCV